MRFFSIIFLSYFFSITLFSQQRVGAEFVFILKSEFLNLKFEANEIGFWNGRETIPRYEKPHTGREDLDEILGGGGMMETRPLGHATLYVPFQKKMYSAQIAEFKEAILNTDIFYAVYSLNGYPVGGKPDYPDWIFAEPIEFVVSYGKLDNYKEQMEEYKQHRISFCLDFLNTIKINEDNDHVIATVWYYLGKYYAEQEWFYGFPDYLEAAHCYMSAKDLNGNLLPFAAYELGKLYEHGQGVPQSFYLAHYYYQQGAKQGYGPCQEIIEKYPVVYPDMKETGTILQTIYPVVFEKEKFEATDCAGKKDEAIQKELKGKCEVKEIENYPLAKGCGECYSADFFSINTNNMKPALYRGLENCNNGKNLSQTFLIFPAMQYFSIEKREIEKWENSLSHSDLNEPSQHQPSKKITPPKYVNLNGGLHELFAQYFSKPKMAVEKKVSGEVVLSFVVEKDGTLSNFIIEKDLGFGIGDEAIRVLAHLGKWEPALFKKLPIRYYVKQTFEIL